ncbi:MAG: DUF488 domain-containing protein, partial [Alphaproteobacteria bacterium]|nr:DUF488 domain-containing protein [Alphaproteobacteria bacterium]
MVDAVYTIGHSTHTVEKLITLLNVQGVTALCDVRSTPYSRMNPQFNRDSLKVALGEAGIGYVFLGAELGARSEDKSCYRRGQLQFDLLARTEPFLRGIERVISGASRYRVALMCAEKEPLDCHRTILVSRSLFECGVPIRHILADGTTEDHALAIERLELFPLKLAHTRRASQIACIQAALSSSTQCRPFLSVRQRYA